MKNVRTKITSIALASLLSLSSMSALAVNAYADWEKGTNGYSYTDENGKSVTGWQTIGGSKYYFGSNGIMRKGLRKISGSTYYFGKDGKMRTGKVKINGKVYDFGKDGKLKKSKTVTLSASGVLEKLKKSLGSSYNCDTVIDSDEACSYFELDTTKIESCIYENNSISAVYMDMALILKVKDGYAKEAAAKLQERYDQIASYSFLGGYDNCKVEQARLFINGNYVALLILGKSSDSDSEAAQKKYAAEEAAKVDAAWEDIFGEKPSNLITIPEVGELEEGMVL